MDSITQIALGSCVAAACLPAKHRRQGALLGAALGTLPDLDVFVDYGDPVANFTMHRGFTHSLFVLAGVGLVFWALLRVWWAPVRDAPRRWFAAILLALLTHPLLDGHTAYGTQLLWPSTANPVSWATIFIIDPLYTIPLLTGMVAILFRPASRTANRWLMAGLILSTLYLAWSWTAQSIVTANARQSLQSRGIRHMRLFITPTPLNTVLWRVVARTDGGYFEGYDSLIADDGEIEFTFHPSNDTALEQASNVPATERLTWFANGFVTAATSGDSLILSDLRMGNHPDYIFRHSVARRGNPHWMAVYPQRLPTKLTNRSLETIWQRIWSEVPM